MNGVEKHIVEDLMEACAILRKARTSLWEDWDVTDRDIVLQELTHAHDLVYRAILNMYAQEIVILSEKEAKQ